MEKTMSKEAWPTHKTSIGMGLGCISACVGSVKGQ